MSTPSMQYNLQSIKRLTSYLNSLDALGIKNLAEEKIGVLKEFQFGFDVETGIFTIKVLTNFQCRIESSEPIRLFGTTVQFNFIFKDYKEVVKQTGEHQVNIPDDLLITLLSLSYSSTRGIITALTAGTDYQNIFLPLINIQEFKTMLKPQESEQKSLKEAK